MKALLEILYRPGALFAELRERRRAWIAPLVVNCLLTALLAFLVPLRRAHLPPAGVAAGCAGVAVSTALMLLALSGALTIFAMMSREPPRFDAVFAMVSISFFPYCLVVTALTAAVLMTAPLPAAIDPLQLLATNVAAYLDPRAVSPGLYSAMTSMDVLSFAEIGLLAYGFARLARVSVFYGLAAVGGLWIMYVSTKVAISLLPLVAG